MHIHAFHFVAGGVLHSVDDGACNTQSITVQMGIASNTLKAIGDCNLYYVFVYIQTSIEVTVHFFGKTSLFLWILIFIYTRPDWQTGSWSIIEFSFGFTHSNDKINDRPEYECRMQHATWVVVLLCGDCRWPHTDYYWIEFSVAQQTGSFLLIHIHPLIAIDHQTISSDIFVELNTYASYATEPMKCIPVHVFIELIW